MRVSGFSSLFRYIKNYLNKYTYIYIYKYIYIHTYTHTTDHTIPCHTIPHHTISYHDITSPYVALRYMRCGLAPPQVPRTWRIFSTSDVVPTVPPKYLWGAPWWTRRHHSNGMGVSSSSWGYPFIAGWFISWKIRSKWMMTGVPLFSETSM